jgi:hypothetical protein
MPEYFYNNQSITEAQILEAAEAENMSFEDFLNSRDDIEIREDNNAFDFTKTNVYGLETPKYGQSFYTYGGEEDVPVEEYGKLANVFRRGNLSLQNAWTSTAISGAEFVNFLDRTGAKTMKFILGEDDAGISIVDPDTKQTIDFNKEAYERDGKDAVENKRWYEITSGDQPYDMIHKETGRRIGESMDNFIIDQYKELAEINKKIQKADIGKGIVGGFKEGDLGDVAIGVANALTSTVTTVVPAILTRGMSLAPQIMAPMYTEYNSEKAKMLYGDDSEESITKLLDNNEDEVLIPFGLGLTATALERIGIKGISSYVLNKAGTAGAKRIAALGLTGFKEGTTEYFQGGLNVANKSLAQGDNMDIVSEKIYDHMTSEHGLEEFLQGVVGGTGISAGGAAIQTAFRNDNDNIQVNNYINSLVSLNQQKLNSNSPDVKTSLNKEIKKTEEAFKNFIILNQKKSEYLTNDQSKEIVNILDSRKKLKYKELQLNKQKNQGVINKDEFNLSIKDINEQLQVENKKLNDIKIEANKKLLHDDLRTSTNAINKILGLEQKVYKTPKEFLDAYNAKTGKNSTLENMRGVDGLVVGKEIMINQEVAANNNAVTVGSHELLHSILKSSITGSKRKIEKEGKVLGETDLTVEGEALIKDFLDTLSKKELSVVQKRIDDNYRFKKDGSEKQFAQYAEEYLNAYADASIKNELSDGLLVKIGKFISKIFNTGNKGYKNLEFKTGADVKAFLNAYVSDRKKGEFRQQFIEMAQEGVDQGPIVEKKSISTAAREQITESVKEIGSTYGFEGGKKSWDEGGADNAITEIKQNNYLDDLIAAKFKGDRVPVDFVDKVYTELTNHIRNFNPETNDNLFGWINSQLANKAGNVFNREYKRAEQETTARDVDDRTKEGEVKVQVAAEKDPTLEAFETEDISPAAEARRKAEAAKPKIQKTSKFRKAIGIETGGEIYNRVLDSARKALIRAYESGKPARNVQRNLRDEANTYLFKTVKNFLGTNTYISNLKNFREAIVDVMFTADLVQLEREIADDKKVLTKFVKQLTSKEEVESAVNQNLLPLSALNTIDKGQAVNLYKKVMPTEEQFIKFFDQPAINPVTGKRSGLKGTRKDGLSKYMAGALAYDATLQVAQEPEVMQKRADIAELNNTEILEDDLQTLAATINRDPNVKFSKNNIKYKQKIIKVKSGQVVVDLNQAQVVLDDIFNNNARINFYRNLTDKQANKYGGKFVVEAIIDQYDSRGIERIDNKTIVNFIKKRKRKRDRISNVYEQFFIELADAAIRQTKSNININQYVKEGGIPDVHFQFEGNSIGLEIKMDSSRGVSYTWKFNDTSTNPNPIDINATEELINKIKKTSENNIFSNINFLKGVTPNDLSTLRTFKHLFNHSVKVTGKYLEYHYTTKKMPEYFINIGDAGLFYMLGQEKDVNNAEVLRIANKLNIPRLEGKFDLISRMSIGSFRADGSRSTNIRIEPRIDSKSNENFSKKSNLNLSSKTDMNNFVKELNNSLIRISRNKNSKILSEVYKFSRSTKNPTKGITVLDFDDTLATTKSLVKFTRPDGTTGTLNAEQYASTYENLLDQGYTFDFSDFNKVVKGKLAPLFQKALKLQGKFGPDNMFVLTARPPQAQKAIFDFLKANGLNIPIKNITGLGNSTAEAKALWMADKVGEGYNDFYFADDALQNVQAVKNMLDQFDVKSKVQQAKVKFSKSMNKDFNNILEDVTGIESKKRFMQTKARKRGESKGKFRFFVPPSHEDFVGLLYNFMGKGRKGDQHRNFFEKALVRPLNRAYREIDTAKQAIANDYKTLNKQLPEIKNKLKKKTPDGDFIFEDAVRIYLWNKHGYTIDGLSELDQASLVELVMNDSKLRQYAETINIISKQDKYVEPGKGWEGGNIQTDLIDATGRVGRAKYFTEFNENADILFSEENLNKIEAAYGAELRSALEDMLYRISTGINRPKGQSGTTNKFMNYLNGSVGTVMFFNVRSAILQQMSIVNYINFADNNIFAAGKAFANQKQYWKDFAFIFNSDMLKQRRGGIGTDINGADLAQSVAGSKNPTKIVISQLLKLGFLPTQIGDNIAIATGGATFYRNRINKYIKDGLSKKEAETKAFTDFQDLTQSTQQSSRPDMTSKQQASWIGKLVLNFQNITSQYNRIIKKAALDIKNGRISPPYTTKEQSNLGNLSKILYYGGIQNVIFYSLQTALFAVMFDDDQDEDKILGKKERVINGSIDSILRGAGIYGAVASTLKNTLIKFKEQREKGYNKDESAVPLELANFSPVVGIKLRQIVNAEKTLNYNENVIGEMEMFDADNPQWSAVTNYTQALTNLPVNRLYQKSINMRNALDKDYTNFQRVMFFSGYTTWSLGLGDNEAIIEAKEKAKINKKNKKKKKRKKIPVF